MPHRTFVIGDIHGCYDEFQQLLDTVPLTSDDRIIHVGDMIDRGPYPAQVVDFFRTTTNAISLMGNREDKHIRAVDGDMSMNTTREITRAQFRDNGRYEEAVDFMRTLPLYIELPEAIVVHGYYESDVSLSEQHRNVLLGHPEGEARLRRRRYIPWYEFYDGEKPILFGHRDYPFLHYERRAFALDTRCVYGGALTGILLPDFVVYTIPARDDHWLRVQEQYTEFL